MTTKGTKGTKNLTTDKSGFTQIGKKIKINTKILTIPSKTCPSKTSGDHGGDHGGDLGRDHRRLKRAGLFELEKKRIETNPFLMENWRGRGSERRAPGPRPEE